MRKVLDTALETRIGEIIEESESAAADIVALLKGLQDAGGVKICQNVSEQDLAYKEVI